MPKIVLLFLFLPILFALFTNINSIYSITPEDGESDFRKEKEQFYKDKHIYTNFSFCKSTKELKRIRKLSSYRKKGYGGHPADQLFSYPLDDTMLISPLVNSKSIYLLLFIHCRPDEFYERYMSRKSIYKSSEISVIYITSKSLNNKINRKLKRESNYYKDILQFNEIASYFNLSIQTVHMILWSNNFKFKYLVKSDIDVYINSKLILQWLKKYIVSNEHTPIAIGRISKTNILRDKKYSHYVPKEIIKDDYFPEYLQGVGYIVSYIAIKQLSETIKYIKPKIWIEDVYMGYCFKYNNVTLINISKYIIRDIPLNISSIIDKINRFMFVHEFYPYELYSIYQINKRKNE